MKSRNTEIFTKGLTHDFDQNIDFTDRCRIEIFLKELTHDFGQKLDISSLFFQQNKPRVMSHDYLVRKRALLDYKKNEFYIVAIMDLL